MLLTEKGKDGKRFFDDELATATCAGFINGAYDTTHNTTFWILWHLASNPEVQDRLRAEVDAAFGQHGDFTMDQCRDLKLMHAVILESNRLRPTVPIGMRCNFSKDLTVSGYPVPKGVTLMPIWSVRDRLPCGALCAACRAVQ